MSTRFADDPRRRAWAYISRFTMGPEPLVNQLVLHLGPVEAAEAIRGGSVPDALAGRVEARGSVDESERDLDLLQSLGGRLITPDDDEWPTARFVDLDHDWDRPPADGAEPVREPTAAPIALWARGSGVLTELTERAVSVVGTRASSGYGQTVAATLASDLATEGYPVVSGAAYGIDAAAHRACVAMERPTVAVLACGIDKAYPAGHALLLCSILDHGLVVSEYPPGTTAARHRFLARNRLIAALGSGVVVVEAGWRSGARNTAGWAKHLGRPALAVPGAAGSATSRRCHRLIRDNDARLITNAAEIIEDVGPIGALAPEPEVRAASTDGLTAQQSAVYDALPARDIATPDALSVESGLPASVVRATLVELELEGLVRAGEGGYLRRK